MDASFRLPSLVISENAHVGPVHLNTSCRPRAASRLVERVFPEHPRFGALRDRLVGQVDRGLYFSGSFWSKAPLRIALESMFSRDGGNGTVNLKP